MRTKTLFTIAALIFMISTLFIQNCSSQWVQVSNGMGNKTVNALWASGNYITAGLSSNYGIYLSTDYGENWEQRGLNSYNVLSLAGIGNYVYAGTIGYGIWRSTNSGMNWTLPSVIYTNIYSLAIDSNYIFAGSLNSGVFFSVNNGVNWTSTSLNNKTVMSLAVKDTFLFAGTVSNGVYFSGDDGVNWVQSALNNRTVYSFAVRENFIFAGTEGFGVYLSGNNGSSWTQVGLSGLTIRSLAVNGDKMFAGVENTSANSRGVYMSVNNGANWIKINEGFSTIPSVYSLLILDNYIFAGTAGNYSVWRRLLSDITEIQNISTETPSSYSLSQNYPNPFNPVTKIRFSVPQVRLLFGGDLIKLKVFDVLGREVQTLVNEKLSPGTYSVDWNASDFPSGVYLYRLQAGDYIMTKRMLMIK